MIATFAVQNEAATALWFPFWLLDIIMIDTGRNRVAPEGAPEGSQGQALGALPLGYVN
ncbi:MAG TPA: hypothetical protein VFD48_16680 [Pyrinomonadaceae bacterium]|nr:hypothetical protein [Pyrinomonadaceae bacterium]